MPNKNNDINDESLLGDLFEDFSEKKADKVVSNSGNEKPNTLIKKVIVLLILSIAVLGGYIYFITPEQELITENNQEVINNTMQDTSGVIDETKTEVKISQDEEQKDYQAVDIKEYNEFSGLFVDKAFVDNSDASFSNVWGEENILNTQDGSIKIGYPKGSYKPSASPRGGAGFIYNIGSKTNTLTLTYDVKFADNFDFMKGGKLPGLCGGDCARGGMDAQDGFSARFAWKKGAKLDLLRSFPGAGQYGQYSQKPFFDLEAGKKYTLSQTLTLNTPGVSDGKLIVKVNGKTVYSKSDLLYRVDESVSIDSILFSTFFGGSDETWATPVDTSIVFSNFRID